MHTKINQQQTLRKLLRNAADTEIGRKYGFGRISDYSVFAEQVPIHFYKDIASYIPRIKQGGSDILWPGTIDRFAVSAGTSGKGKHIPLTADRLDADRRFMKSVAFSYLKQRPNVFRLWGKHLSLPGTLEQQGDLLIGEVSGFSALNSPSLLSWFQLHDPAELTKLSFRDKFDLLLSKALKSDLRVITAVPSWILPLFQEALASTGKNSIAELWPNLRLLVCGGVKLSSYRAHLEILMGDLNPDFVETYGASEGYFAYSDQLGKESLRLLTDNGIFYEFIKDPLPDEDALVIQESVALWEVETGVPYAVVVSTNAGLWRYALRDIIEFTSVHPPRIRVRGRLSEMLDDYGEGLYLFEAEQALEETTSQMGLNPGAFTIAPRLLSEREKPFHHWLICFAERPHRGTLDRLAEQIDRVLKEKNRHYAIRRESDALAPPRIASITQQDISRWLEASDKVSAQGKLPGVLRDNVEVLL